MLYLEYNVLYFKNSPREFKGRGTLRNSYSYNLAGNLS